VTRFLRRSSAGSIFNSIAACSTSRSRRLVGHDELHARASRPHVVHAGQAGDHALGVDEGAGRREVSTEVGDVGEAQREKFPLRVERELAFAYDVPSLLVGEEDLRAAAGPFHRPADPLRGEQRRAVLRVHVEAHPEAAAHVLGDHVDLVVRNAHGIDELAAHARGPLGTGVERVLLRLRVVGRQARTRLHRVADHARVLERDFHDLARRAERRVGRGLVARDPVEGEVAGQLGVQLRRARRERLFGDRDRGQLLVLDGDQLGRVLRRVRRLGDDAGDALADVAHLALSEHRAGRFLQRLAVAVLHPEVRGNRAVTGLGDVLAGEHREHSRRSECGGDVDRHDVGVRPVRAQERRVGLVREIPIGGELALPGQQPPVFQSSLHIGRRIPELDARKHAFQTERRLPDATFDPFVAGWIALWLIVDCGHADDAARTMVSPMPWSTSRNPWSYRHHASFGVQSQVENGARLC
jgi:hypothetical protein